MVASNAPSFLPGLRGAGVMPVTQGLTTQRWGLHNIGHLKGATPVHDRSMVLGVLFAFCASDRARMGRRQVMFLSAGSGDVACEMGASHEAIRQ